MDLFDGTSPALHEPATRRYDERLAERMGMPGRAGARLKRDARTLYAPGSTCLEQRLDAHLPGEGFFRSLARRSRTASLDLHVFRTPLARLRPQGWRSRSRTGSARRRAAYSRRRR